MSLENAIQENTKALQSLAEIIKQALSMKPVRPPLRRLSQKLHRSNLWAQLTFLQ